MKEAIAVVRVVVAVSNKSDSDDSDKGYASVSSEICTSTSSNNSSGSNDGNNTYHHNAYILQHKRYDTTLNTYCKIHYNALQHTLHTHYKTLKHE